MGNPDSTALRDLNDALAHQVRALEERTAAKMRDIEKSMFESQRNVLGSGRALREYRDREQQREWSREYLGEFRAPSPEPAPAPPFIGPYRTYAELTQRLPDVAWAGKLHAAIAGAIKDEAERAMKEFGLIPQSEPITGLYLELDEGDGYRYQIDREHLFAAIRDDVDIDAGVRMQLSHICGANGPGRVWFLADPVHVVSDGERCKTARVRGTERYYTIVRTIYCHEGRRARVGLFDPLAVKYDGTRLRDLLAMDLRNRREVDVFRVIFTPAQRTAISAHHSAHLRAKVEASTERDRELERNRVTVESDLE